MKNLDVVLRHEYRAGEKLFVDYAGDKIPIYDRQTGEVDFQASLFVAVLGASSYTFAEANRSQDLSCWIDSHVRALEFFGGAPEVVIPDNTKTGVKHPCRYEPELNPTYRELAEHYGFAVVPARPYKPRDKAKVEAGVQVAQRWIVAALRHRKFFHLADLNEAIAELLDRLNARPFRKRPDVSRTLLFEQLDRPALKPLPVERYVLAHWKPVRPNIDYHVEIERHYYSVPFQLVGQQLDARYTAMTVEIFHRGTRVASHMPQLRCLRRHHHPRTSAQESSGASGVDTLAFDQLGRNRRSRHRRGGPHHFGEKATSGSGLSCLPGNPQPGQDLLGGAFGSGQPAGLAAARSIPTRV